MKVIVKIILLVVFVLGSIQTRAQSVKGTLTLNNSNKIELSPENNSVVSLFRDFKMKKYAMQFHFKAYNVPKNIYGETVVLFNFITQIKKDGKLIKEIKREEPLPYFPGDMFLAPESFDFISILGSIDGNDTRNSKYLGTLPAGEYTIVLDIVPLGFEGNINPLEIYFALRKRPTR
ncbi:hypothetical protein GTQ40_17170 [Flavobacteriaceae bacterium R38]|nr:hypothetical protein [Flavobacteriaceae bacterium R38]